MQIEQRNGKPEERRKKRSITKPSNRALNRNLLCDEEEKEHSQENKMTPIERNPNNCTHPL